MYSQDRQDFNLPPARAAVKKWHQSFWGRAIIAFLAVFFTLFVALAIYVGQVVILLRAGELTTDQLFGQSGQTAAERVVGYAVPVVLALALAAVTAHLKRIKAFLAPEFRGVPPPADSFLLFIDCHSKSYLFFSSQLGYLTLK